MTGDELLQKAHHAQQSGDAAEAERLYRALVDTYPDHAQGRRLFAIFLLGRGLAAEAETHIAIAASLLPDEPYVHQNHALVLTTLERYEEAAEAAGRAIKRDPDYALAYFNRGNALAQAGRPAEALRDFERAETRGIKDHVIYFAIGHTLNALGRRDEALAAYEKSLIVKPDFVASIANRGVVLTDMHRPLEALAAFDRALQIQPDSAQLHNMRGTVLYDLKRFPEAADCYRRALALEPNYGKAYFNVGLLLMENYDFERARAAFDRAFALVPGLPHLESNRLHMYLQLCDWNDYDNMVATMLAHADSGTGIAKPFQLLNLPSSADQQFKAATQHASEKCPPQKPFQKRPRAPGRLRIAYVSKDYYDHATALLFTEVLENHDRNAVEIFGVGFGVDDGSHQRARMIAACENFIDLRSGSDRQIAEQIHTLGIDIAVDLDGYTKDARPAILSWRPAPVQTQFLGYPGTMGASHIDYILSDAIVTPPEMEPWYSEKFALLPGTYQPNGARPDLPRVSRAEAGLPETGFVFGCFNNNFKLSPRVFDSWMRILARVPGSVFWLLGNNDTARANLNKETEKRGIDPARLIFARTTALDKHIARLKCMDLFLDSFFYGAHTTASDALWSGVPVISKLGETFPGRVAASVLTAIGLPELITHSDRAYEDLAVALATDPARLAEVRAKIQAQRGRLFDPAQYARNLEAAFRQMWARHEAGQKPESFAVAAEK